MDKMSQIEGGSSSFIVPSDLSQYDITLEDFLTRNPKYTNLAVGAYLFHENRLLIVQRSKHEHAFPNLWEIPGGSCDPTDKSILHGAARELMEETGLKVTAFVRAIGEGREFQSGTPARKKEWIKFSFEVEVARVGNGVTSDASTQADNDNTIGETHEILVSLDPNEHQAHLWVTEDEVQNERAGEVSLAFTTTTQKQKILEAFDTRSRPLEGKGGRGEKAAGDQ